ncbi:MAG: T9SS type A sorting domain-containing protein [Chitinophagaceae bacterium]|nr:T9SS type A sorting domain-containing protein [Chitinophagaceae bacterium]
MKKFTFILFLTVLFTKSFSQINLGNLVWNDANGNGFREVYENGIGGITVKLYNDVDANNFPDGPGNGTVIATATTAVDGSYLFTSLAAGRYITSIAIPAGYSFSPAFSATPDDNLNNDNNSAVLFNNQSEVRSNAITLTYGGEPTNDGDGIHGNLTLDLAICGNTVIGDFVWCDRNANGIQEDNESGFANVKVTLTFADGTTYTKYTDADGKYEFVNLGPDIHTLTFETPVGFNPSPALQGADRGMDSDPINGRLTFTVLASTNNFSFGAGFYMTGCVVGNCGAGFVQINGSCFKDTDGDCIADKDDLDDDNDGIIDMVENNGYDALADCDGDGTPNYKDATPGCPTPGGTDIYGNPYKPLVWLDCNGDTINDFFDWDRDGIINELDLDSDNDGILDIREARDTRATDNNADGMADGVDADGDGIMSSADVNDAVYGGPGLFAQDLDRDGNPNYVDLDSDGDGVVDITEALLFIDSDGLANGTDGDKDGVMTVVYNNSDNSADNFIGFGAKGIRVQDTDDDGYPNPYDIDSDNDGITDNVEAQPTCVEVQPFGIDTDKDGLDDAYDIDNNACKFRAHGITPYDKDGDGTPDMYDLDTDNDGAPDFNEGSGITGDFITNYNDTDGDGLIDQFDIFNIKTATTLFINNVAHSNMGPNGNFDGPVPAGSSPQLPQQKPGDCGTGADRDWRDISVLPVNLLDFKALLVTNKVQLTWTTASEVNMKQYIVERSVDGNHFSPVAKVGAKGGAVTNQYFIADDVTLLNVATVYYRLRQVDNSQQAKLSKVLSVKTKPGSIVMLNVTPNPAQGFVRLSISALKETNAVLKITDAFGRLVYVSKTMLAAGINTVSLNNLSAYAAGTYTIQVILDTNVLSQRLLILN